MNISLYNPSPFNFLLSLILSLLCIFIHELGHAFFVKINGGKVKNIQLGIGGEIFSIGIFSINRVFFIGGLCSWEWGNQQVSNFQKFFVYIGGVLFNGLFIGALFLFRILFNVESIYIGYLNFINFLLIILCLIPIYYSKDLPSDGKQLIDLLKKS